MSQLTDDIRNNMNIVDIISRYVQLKRAGSNYSGLCPFHNEKSPSFMVSPTKQIFKCFGCGKGGDVFTFLQEIERIDFWDAVKELAKEAHIDLGKYEVNPEKMEQYADQKEKIKRLHTLTQQFFIKRRQESDIAKKYLVEKRHLDQQTIDHFGIGYAPDSHYDLMQYLKEKKFGDQDMQDASLAKKGNSGDTYAFFRNRITFPIYDHMQNVIGFGARIIDPNDKPKYLNSSDHIGYEKSKVLYGLHLVKQHIKTHPYLIVVEGYMDVIGLYRLGFPTGIATCGTSLTDQHMDVMQRYTDTVYLLFDNDQAGQQATIRALKIAYAHNLFPKIIQLPEGHKDVDDLANTDDGKDIFTNAKESAQDGFSVVFAQLKTGSDRTSPVGKQRLLKTMFGLILAIDNVPMQNHYLDLLAHELGMAYEILLPQYKQYAKTEGRMQLRKQQSSQQTKSYQPDREAIAAALLYQNFIDQYVETVATWEPLLIFKKHISTLLPDTLFAKAMNDKVTNDENEILHEMQLWRENELGKHDNEEAQIALIKKITGQTMQQYLQQILKNPSLGHEEKQKILQLKRDAGWK